MNEIVKYNNYFNTIPLRDFTAGEMDLLMTILSRLRDHEAEVVTINFQEIKEKAGYTGNSVLRLIHQMEQLYDKLLHITCKWVDGEGTIHGVVLFTTYAINVNHSKIEIGINEKYKFLLNGLLGNFTRFELSEFVGLESKYSKSLYRLLKQYKTTGVMKISDKDLRDRLDIPEKYRSCDVKRRALDPTVSELGKYFVNLKCTPIKARKRGAPIEAYEFKFRKESVDNQNVRKTKKDNFHNFKENKYSEADYAYLDCSRTQNISAREKLESLEIYSESDFNKFGEEAYKYMDMLRAQIREETKWEN